MNIKMLNSVIISFFLFTVAAQAANQNLPTCRKVLRSQESQIRISDVNSTIATPESLPTIKASLEHLESMIDLAKSHKDSLAEIYFHALPVLQSTLEFGKKIIQLEANDQDQVYEYFQRFSQIIDLAINYTDKIGEYAEGYNSVTQFSEQAYQERLKDFLGSYKTPIPILQAFIDKVNAKPKENLRTSFNYITINNIGLPNDLKFPFQYQYIFKEGILSLKELFKDRESGRVYLGISFSESAPYDGQYGNSISFKRHDEIHAFSHKYYDLLIFNEFQADTLEKMKRLKSITNELLQSRIAEYERIQNPTFRRAIELSFFVLLHEQSLTYPVATARFFDNPKNQFDLIQRVHQFLKMNHFGKSYKRLTKAQLNFAFNWIKKVSQEDLNQLMQSYK